MYRLLKYLFLFFKDAIFNSKEERDFFSRKFNIKKFIAYSVLLLSLSINYISVSKLFSVTTLKFDLEDELGQCTRLNAELLEQINDLETKVSKVKNKSNSPSNSKKYNKTN